MQLVCPTPAVARRVKEALAQYGHFEGRGYNSVYPTLNDPRTYIALWSKPPTALLEALRRVSGAAIEG